jgi:hypothetical protein
MYTFAVEEDRLGKVYVCDDDVLARLIKSRCDGRRLRRSLYAEAVQKVTLDMDGRKT